MFANQRHSFLGTVRINDCKLNLTYTLIDSLMIHFIIPLLSRKLLVMYYPLKCSSNQNLSNGSTLLQMLITFFSISTTVSIK